MKKQYVQISAAEKLALLQKHSMGEKWTSLDDTKWCLHCNRQFSGHSVRFYQDGNPGLWLECGTPGCDGSPIDWADYPWWDENHPKVKAQDEAFEKLDRVTKCKKPKNN